MHQRGRTQGEAAASFQVVFREPVQLAVKCREQLIGRLGISLIGAAE